MSSPSFFSPPHAFSARARPLPSLNRTPLRRILLRRPALFAGPSALLLWYFVRGLPFLPTAALFVLLTPATGGRMLIARLTERPHRPRFIVLRPGASVDAIVLHALIAFGIVRVALELLLTIRHLSHPIRPDEILYLAVKP